MFDEQRYVSEVLNPLRNKHLPDNDLVRQYAVDLGLDEVQLQETLRKVREVWTRRSGGGTSMAQLCNRLKIRDAELRKKHGAQLNSRLWWQEQAAREAQAARIEAQQFSEDLRNAFGSLGMVTTAQILQIAKQRGADPDSVSAAARQGGIEVVEPVDLPTGPGLERTAYETLKTKTTQLGLRSFLPLVYPEAEHTPFCLLGEVTIGGTPKAFDAKAIAQAIAQSEVQANSATLRTRKEALGLLQMAVRGGTDLRLLALFHLAEPLREERAHGLAEALLVRGAIQRGLAERDAKLLVLSLPAGGAKPVIDHPARIRELLNGGELRAAEAAFATLPVTDPEHAGLAEMLRERREALDQSLLKAADAEAAQREELAEQVLSEAVRIAADDPEVEARLRRLRPPPPREATATIDDERIRLVWQPPATAVRLTYRVLRAERRPPVSPTDGTSIAETEEPQALDHMPPAAVEVHYAVFAVSGNGVWSRPAHATTMLVPAVSNVQVGWVDSHVEGGWSVHPAVNRVEVLRAVGTDARAADHGTPVNASTNRFRDVAVDKGDRYVYRLVAVYRGADGVEVRGNAVYATALMTRDRPAHVASLEATAQAGEANTTFVRLRWTTPQSDEVFIRYADTTPPWPPGTVVTREEMDRYGTRVAGDRIPVGDETEMQAEVPPGELVYTPFTARPDRRLTVGAPYRTGIFEPVRDLVAERLGGRVTVSWIWPEGTGLVEVTISRRDGQVDKLRLSLAEYKQRGGLNVPAGALGATISVRVVRPSRSGETHSAPATVSVGGESVPVRYDIKRASRFGRQCVLSFGAAEEVSGVSLRIVAASGPAMPANPEQGHTLEKLDGLRLIPGAPLALTVSIPKHLRSPVWLRCFLLAPPSARMVDPSPSQMKVM